MRYYSTIGMSREQFDDLGAGVRNELRNRGYEEAWFALDFLKQLEVVLVLLRNNVSQMLAAEMFDVSQPTVSRIMARLAPIVRHVLGWPVHTLAQVGNGRVLIVDGTFIPTGNRPGEGKELEKANYSGKHHVQAINVQVAARTDGALVAVSDPVAGSRHDSAALKITGWEQILAHCDWLADTAYIATNAITPRKKRRGEHRTEADKMFNKSVSSIRSAIEHTIRRLKEWKILATGYRGRLTNLPDIIKTITQLEFYRQGTITA